MVGPRDSEEACNAESLKRFLKCEFNSLPAGTFFLIDFLIILLKTFSSLLLHCNAAPEINIAWPMLLKHWHFAYK